MTWKNEWNAIAARIDAIITTGNMLMQVFSKSNEDPLGMSGKIIQQVVDLETSLQNFAVQYGGLLPNNASKALETYISSSTQKNYIPSNPLLNTSSKLVGMHLLLSEVNYYLTDFSEIIKRQSERAFLHLQQIIVADSEAQRRWQNAFNKDGTDCERLGAAHLLHHGIFAFKAHTSQGRTDLVFGEPIINDEIARVADGLVLTEWKKVVKPSDRARKAGEARKQTTIYNASVLGGVELKDYRYIVLVSMKQLPTIADVSENGITYRHINIAVNPESPSKAARN